MVRSGKLTLVGCTVLYCSFAAFAQGPVPDSPQIEARVNEAIHKLTLAQTIAVIGPNAWPATTGGGGSCVRLPTTR